MAEPALLSPDELLTLLAELHAWEHVDDRIRRSFRFESFAAAFGWMSEIAIHAERMNHHPEWSNVYSRVDVELTTHDVGGLSMLDVELARRMDAAASDRS